MFDNLVAGDEIITSYTGYGAVPKLTKVEKVTKTLIIVDGRKYRKRDGESVSQGTFNMHFLIIPTPEFITSMNLEKARKENIGVINKFLSRAHDKTNEELQVVADSIRGLEDNTKLKTLEKSSSHWTTGGTGITNFQLSEMDTYIAAVEEFNDPKLFVIDKPMLNICTSNTNTTQGSLHCVDIHKVDLSAFWAIYEKHKERG